MCRIVSAARIACGRGPPLLCIAYTSVHAVSAGEYSMVTCARAGGEKSAKREPQRADRRENDGGERHAAAAVLFGSRACRVSPRCNV